MHINFTVPFCVVTRPLEAMCAQAEQIWWLNTPGDTETKPSQVLQGRRWRLPQAACYTNYIMHADSNQHMQKHHSRFCLMRVCILTPAATCLSDSWTWWYLICTPRHTQTHILEHFRNVSIGFKETNRTKKEMSGWFWLVRVCFHAPTPLLPQIEAKPCDLLGAYKITMDLLSQIWIVWFPRSS